MGLGREIGFVTGNSICFSILFFFFSYCCLTFPFTLRIGIFRVLDSRKLVFDTFLKVISFTVRKVSFIENSDLCVLACLVFRGRRGKQVMLK